MKHTRITFFSFAVLSLFIGGGVVVSQVSMPSSYMLLERSFAQEDELVEATNRLPVIELEVAPPSSQGEFIGEAPALLPVEDPQQPTNDEAILRNDILPKVNSAMDTLNAAFAYALEKLGHSSVASPLHVTELQEAIRIDAEPPAVERLPVLDTSEDTQVQPANDQSHSDDQPHWFFDFIQSWIDQ